MYSWLWRHLPGPVLARAAQAVALVCAVLAALFFVVFPAVEGAFPYQDVTVPNGAPQTSGTGTTPAPSAPVSSPGP